ncbi:hypothetical protein HPB50_012528 [Hyalomma asiaticum]|uniref:Uncharacterized protein n=1 Tax=Hyalomma asiaticum TaxID=266040 RepID=A0ACB7SKH3_HYAAI|nr:hypothetical protein HPB50_012528 [Hyalomma asiaticum]
MRFSASPGRGRCQGHRFQAAKWLDPDWDLKPQSTFMEPYHRNRPGVDQRKEVFLLISTPDVLPDAAFLCGDTSCSVEMPVNSTQPPRVDNHQFLRQQPWASTTIINATIFGGGTAYKHFPGEACLGHDTGSGMERLPCLLLQRIDSRQEEILNDLRALKLWQTSVDAELKQISSRMHAVEADVMALKQSEGPSTSSSQFFGVNICEKIKAIESRCEDAENRSRRCNLLFFGLPDEPSESWFSSEQKVIQLCSQHLGITPQSSQIERLGRYNTGKCRPIITKLTFFKDKHSIMEMGHKLKGTLFAIREDFAPQTRQDFENV